MGFLLEAGGFSLNHFEEEPCVYKYQFDEPVTTE